VQNGQDHLIGWGATTVRSVWYDYDSFSPGLELATQWSWIDNVTPVRVSGSVFTVTGAKGLNSWFGEYGRSVRHRSDGGTTWHYSHINSWSFNANGSFGTVVLRHPILSNPLGTVELTTGYQVSTMQYHYVGAGA
jgi:hypothetical protein